MIDRLLAAHETIIDKVRVAIDKVRVAIDKVRVAIDKTESSRDFGTNDLLMGDVLRRRELQVWFVAEHVVNMPLVEA